MTTAVGDALGVALREGRTDFNQRFEVARRQFPQLAGDDVIAFLRDNVAPAASAIYAYDDAALRPFVSAAYDAVLLLCGHKIGGAASRSATVGEGWRRILPVATRHLARAAGKVLAAISNALHAIANTPGARPHEWIDGMTRCAPVCRDADELLRAGQVLAWLAGLAHLRAGALDAARNMEAGLAASLLGLPSAKNVESVLVNLAADPWLDPRVESPGVARIAREFGGFRGFGGPFLSTPRLAAVADGWLVESGSQYGFVIADAFGATLHRASKEEWRAASIGTHPPRGVSLAGNSLRIGKLELELPIAGPVTSFETSAAAIAVTSAHTFFITFVALS